MKRKTKPRILYAKYLENHREELEKQEYEKKLNTDTVVVNKMTAGAKIMQLMADVFRWGVKILLISVILGLLSLAMTVLINEPLRRAVFDYLGF